MKQFASLIELSTPEPCGPVVTTRETPVVVAARDAALEFGAARALLDRLGARRLDYRQRVSRAAPDMASNASRTMK